MSGSKVQLPILILGTCMLMAFCCGGFVLRSGGGTVAPVERPVSTRPTPQMASSTVQATPQNTQPKNEKIDVAPVPKLPIAAPEPLEDRLLAQIKEQKPQFKREWKASNGKATTQATMISYAAGKVKLLKEDGKEIDVPLDKLSEVDQYHVGYQIKSDANAFVLFAKNATCVDADTIDVPDAGGRSLLIDLKGVTAPKQSDIRYQKSLEGLKTKISGQPIWIEWKSPNAGGSTEGVVYLDGRNINLELIAEGHAKPKLTDDALFNEQMANALLLNAALSRK